jgi:cell division transport system permease protein
MSLKRILSFNIPLIITLVIFALYGGITKLLSSYEESINNDYSIILVMNTPINETKLKALDSIDLKEIKHIKRDSILKELEKELTEGSYAMLQNKLPYFYNIYLNDFPTSFKLKEIEKELKTLSGIKEVETFSKDHDDLYSLLLLIKSITLTLFGAIFIFTFIIINNQVLIWFYEHQERLDIIKLHGGTIFYGAKPIIKLGFYSSIITTAFVTLIVYLITTNLSQVFSFEIVQLLLNHPVTFEPTEIGYLFVLSLAISTITVFGVLIKHRIK